jgi:hypothetical protein
MKDGTMMNLNADKPGERINSLLKKGFYFQDAKDIELISSVVRKLGPPILRRWITLVN